MDEASYQAWFYTRNGERTGPIAFADLQDVAAAGALNPRLDMIWTQGMESWRPAGEIEGLFERRAAEEPEIVAVAASQPQPEIVEEHQAEWPGVRRAGYILVTLVLPIVLGGGSGFAAAAFRNDPNSGAVGLGIVIGALVLLILVIWTSLQRLANLAMSRWWFLGNLVPLLQLWVGYRCFACPPGYAEHKKLDGAGKFLALLYWLVVAIGVIAVIAGVAAMTGLIGSPEIQQKIREAYAQAQHSRPPLP